MYVNVVVVYYAQIFFFFYKFLSVFVSVTEFNDLYIATTCIIKNAFLNINVDGLAQCRLVCHFHFCAQALGYNQCSQVLANQNHGS